MTLTTFRAAALLAGAVAASGAIAQAAPAPARPDPLDPTAAVPAARHASALERYRSTPEIKLESWREANDRVARIGGWRAYAREAAQPASAPSRP